MSRKPNPEQTQKDEIRIRKGKPVLVSGDILYWRKHLKAKGVCGEPPRKRKRPNKKRDENGFVIPFNLFAPEDDT